MGHTCHALACERPVPPRMHMCGPHWALVPRALQRELWRHYRKGQERDKQPSAEYLYAAAACVEAVACEEGHDEADIEIEVESYTVWAGILEQD